MFFTAFTSETTGQNNRLPLAAYYLIDYIWDSAFVIASNNPAALAMINNTPITTAITITKQKYDLAKFLLFTLFAAIA